MLCINTISSRRISYSTSHPMGPPVRKFCVFAVVLFPNTHQRCHMTYRQTVIDIMPYYLVLEFESSLDTRNKKWSNSLVNIDLSPHKYSGPQVLEGYCYSGAFFSPHHFAELKYMYDKQLLSYEYACKKLPIMAKTHQQSCVPNDLPTLKKFLEAGKRTRKRRQNISEVRNIGVILGTVL